MADTSVINYKGHFIEVSFTGAGADVDFTTKTGIPVPLNAMGQLKVNSITFVPGAATDVCTITETENGPRLFVAKNIVTTSGVTTQTTQYYQGTWMRPFFDLSLSTLGAPTSSYIIIELG